MSTINSPGLCPDPIPDHIQEELTTLRDRVMELEGDLRETAKDSLLRRMEDISEDFWCAGWIRGLEFSLWRDINEHPDLAKLSKQCGGWWIWADCDDMRKFVSTDEWLKIYTKEGQP